MRKALLLLLAGMALSACDRAMIETTLQDEDSLMRLVYMLAFLVFIVWGGGYLRRGRIGETLRHGAILLGLFLVVIGGYAYRDEARGVVNRVLGELSPMSPRLSATGQVMLRQAADGHFSTLAQVNGRPTVFLIDTGASSVVLPFQEAIRLGYNSGDLIFSRRVQTANGTAFEAPITIPTLKIGDIVMHDVEAAVAEPGNLNKSLLGMSFLNRLSGYSFEGKTLTFRE